MNQRNISKKISLVIIVLLIIECVIFGTWYVTQPSYKATIVSLVNNQESVDQSYYYNSPDHKNGSIDSVFNAINIYSYLDNLDLVDSVKVSNYIISNFNTTTGLFSEYNVSSLQATYEAVSCLTILNQSLLLNKTLITNAVLRLRTNDSLFRDYSETNATQELTGEIDHLYQAVTILKLLTQNQTELLTKTLNLTSIFSSIQSLQSSDGGINEGLLYSSPNMQNAYYLTDLLTYFNSYINISNFRFNDLQNWINSMYSYKGFKMQGDSEATVEATAYAVIALKNLGFTIEQIQNSYSEGITSLFSFLDSNFRADTSRNSLDVLNDLLNSMNQMNLLSRLNKPYFNEQSQLLFVGSIAVTILAFIINSFTNLVLSLKEDDTKFFEGKLHVILEKIISQGSNDYQEFSDLLHDTIQKIEIQSVEQDDKLGILRAYSQIYRYNVTFETYSYLAKKVEKYSQENDLLSVLDFLDADIFFTIEEGQQHLELN